MLGVRLKPEEEERLARHAREVGRPKSAIVRDWIVERLERTDIDDQLRRAAALLNQHYGEAERVRSLDLSDAFSQQLDAEDGGYDWGPAGPPTPRG